MNFEDLQQAWQKQEVPELSTPNKVNTGQDKTLDQVKALQRKVLISNIMMSVCLIFTCVFYVYLWHKNPGTTIWYDLGMILIFAAMILTGALVWLRSMPWGNLKADLSNREYIDQTLKSFIFRQTTLKIIMPIYMFTLYLGITFIYFEIFQEATLQTRIWVHIGLTVFMVFLGWLSHFYHRQKYKDNFEPVITELEIIKKEFEEQLNEHQ